MATIAHIIRDDEVELTECGEMLPPLPAGEMWTDEPVKLSDGSIAIWDNIETPRGASTCSKCWDNYQEARS